MSRTRQVTPAVYSWIIDRATEEPRVSATSIAAEMRKRFRRLKTALPSTRSVQEMVKEYRPPDPSDWWSLADADLNDAPLVLDTLAAVMNMVKNPRQSVTVDHATWIVRVRRACPEMNGWDAWRVARRYLVREARGKDTADLDALLGFWPRAGMSDEEKLQRAVQRAALHGKLWADRPFSPMIYPDEEYEAYLGAVGLSKGGLTDKEMMEASLAAVSEPIGSSIETPAKKPKPKKEESK